MKRDDDQIRNLLLSYEEHDEWLFLMPGDTHDSTAEERKERYHVLLMIDAGLLTMVKTSTFRLTNSGHDFLAAIRDDGIWQKTKEAVAKTGGNAAIELVRAIAMGFARKKLEQFTGLTL